MYHLAHVNLARNWLTVVTPCSLPPDHVVVFVVPVVVFVVGLPHTNKNSFVPGLRRLRRSRRRRRRPARKVSIKVSAPTPSKATKCTLISFRLAGDFYLDIISLRGRFFTSISFRLEGDFYSDISSYIKCARRRRRRLSRRLRRPAHAYRNA